MLSLPNKATLSETRTDFWATKVSLLERVDCVTKATIMNTISFIPICHGLVFNLQPCGGEGGGGGGGGEHHASFHNFAIFVPMIMKFDAVMKHNGIKKVCDVTIITYYNVITCIFADG